MILRRADTGQNRRRWPSCRVTARPWGAGESQSRSAVLSLPPAELGTGDLNRRGVEADVTNLVDEAPGGLAGGAPTTSPPWALVALSRHPARSGSGRGDDRPRGQFRGRGARHRAVDGDQSAGRGTGDKGGRISSASWRLHGHDPRSTTPLRTSRCPKPWPTAARSCPGDPPAGGHLRLAAGNDGAGRRPFPVMVRFSTAPVQEGNDAGDAEANNAAGGGAESGPGPPFSSAAFGVDLD